MTENSKEKMTLSDGIGESKTSVTLIADFGESQEDVEQWLLQHGGVTEGQTPADALVKHAIANIRVRVQAKLRSMVGEHDEVDIQTALDNIDLSARSKGTSGKTKKELEEELKTRSEAQNRMIAKMKELGMSDEQIESMKI